MTEQNSNLDNVINNVDKTKDSNKQGKLVIIYIGMAIGFLCMMLFPKIDVFNQGSQETETQMLTSDSSSNLSSNTNSDTNSDSSDSLDSKLTREILETSVIPAMKKQAEKDKSTFGEQKGIYIESVELGKGVSLVISYKLTNKEFQAEDYQMDDNKILYSFCNTQIKMISALDYAEIIYKRKDLSVISDVKITKEACQNIKKPNL